MATLEDMSSRALARGKAQALEYQRRWITWDDMKQVADRVNQLIDETGANRQAPVALVPRNRPSALAALLGLIATGRNILMVHVYQSPSGLARDLTRLRPAVAILSEVDVSAEVCAALKAEGIAGIGLTQMNAAAVEGCERSSVSSGTSAARPQISMLTSGTTGAPKHCPLSYDVIAQHMLGVNVMGTAHIANAAQLPPMLLYYPFGNFSGVYATLPPVLHGIRGVLVDRFTISEWHDYIRRYRPESTGLPTAGLQMILDADIPVGDLACLRWIHSGAAPLDPGVQRAFEERYGKPILLVYGATELGGPVATMTPELHAEWGAKKLGSVGRAYAGARLRIVDPETGAVLPAGAEGLLEVISPRIGPHWIRTSDIVLLDEDGFLFHRGRADGAIVRGGFKLLPDTIERALCQHDAVGAAGVIGIPDRRLGQVPAAAVRLKSGMSAPTTAELEKHLRNLVEATHIPVVWRFVETLPYTSMMKLDRIALRHLFDSAAP